MRRILAVLVVMIVMAGNAWGQGTTSVPKLVSLPDKTPINVSLDVLITNDPDIDSWGRPYLKDVGAEFTATVGRDVVVDNFVVVFKGAKAYGRITESYYSMYKKSRLNLELTGITIYDGSVLPIKAKLHSHIENNKQPGAGHIVREAAVYGVVYGAAFALMANSASLNAFRAFGLGFGGFFGTLKGFRDRKLYETEPVYLFNHRNLWFKVRK